MSKLQLLISVFILSAYCMFAQEGSEQAFNPQKKFPVSDLQADFRLLTAALEQSHPGLYSYNTKQEIKTRFDSIYNSLKNEQTELQFYSSVSSLLASIGCGHTVAFLSKKYKKDFEEKTCRYFPFKIKILDRRIYILSNQSTDSSIVVGTEILELNGQSAGAIQTELLPFLCSDGHNVTLKQHAMMNGFLFYYSEFIGQPLWFRLKLKAPNDELPKFVSVPALTLKEIHRFSLRRTTRPSLALNTKPLQFQITDENVAILTIRSFDDRDFLHAKQHFHAFIRKSFESMKQHGVTDLVLDIRENGGGDDYNARFLYSYLTDSTFRYYDRVEIAGNTKISFLNHTNKPLLLRFFRFFVKPDPAASGRYLWVHSPLSQAHDPRSSTYTGSVFILINGESFSATSEFAAIASYHKRALFMGEETGGCYEGDNSGLEMILTLPHTHIRVRIPMMKYVLAVGSHTPAGRGIMPDYTILPSVKDLLDGIDTEKEFTLDLIRKKNCKGCGR